MAIEKMELVNIVGVVRDIDQVLLKCCQSKCFHMELSVNPTENNSKLVTLNEDNPYTNTLKRLDHLVSNLEIAIEDKDAFLVPEKVIEGLDVYLSDIELEYNEYYSKLQDLKQSISDEEQAIAQLTHLAGLTANFEQIFACEHVKVRVGKLPVDSYPKLVYYEDENFIFIKLHEEESYVWGMYFSPVTIAPIIDEIFRSLYFERVRVPDFVKGTPEKAYADLNKKIEEQKAEALVLTQKIVAFKNDNQKKLSDAFIKLRFLNATFDLRKMVATVNKEFYIVGFVPQKQAKYFESLFDDMPTVSVILKPATADPQLKPPTKMKNGFFSKPFSMLVEMYGLPAYNGINPTVFFAITYTLLFGLMFGDIGQGAVLLIIGIILSKVKKMKAGGIVSRIGVSSMFFGFVYGSVFGYEHILDPVYKGLGWEGKPIEVFEQASNILLGAVALGSFLMIISIVLNIILGFRQKDYEKAIFGANGIVGLVFYLAIIIGGVVTIFGEMHIFTLPYILGLVILPLLLMFFRVPLASYMKNKKLHHGEESEGIGIFIAENFFELFEFLLSYITNTMSFLRIGGFILSHAGMMLVVMTLAESVSAGASPFVVVLGNIFVMGMEGMIVGIQAIRLEFYEIFSRFYDGNGKPFVPVGVNLDADIE